ncbi:hypothetical protein DSO57_1022937 [Entomophthora muscae]|uniref:Uncharacterized protein n=1 Tax=Entomophthora muscae TaxID=34485 RepID=A0ACC2UPF2_9FUNG|nr:hypothetical protein DSO57_1022937 [Entomophthora muscae]
MLPDALAAGAFLQANFPPEEAVEWYDTGATAAEATIFKQGGWNPATVTNWIKTNNMKYSDINKFIHTTISPALAVKWKRLGFSATEALQWAAMEIQEGFIPFEEAIREHTAQGDLHKTPPRSSINYAICIYVNNISKGSFTQCKDAIYEAFDCHFPDQQVDSN